MVLHFAIPRGGCQMTCQCSGWDHQTRGPIWQLSRAKCPDYNLPRDING